LVLDPTAEIQRERVSPRVRFPASNLRQGVQASCSGGALVIFDAGEDMDGVQLDEGISFVSSTTLIASRGEWEGRLELGMVEGCVG
jgi:hypothetical protein